MRIAKRTLIAAVPCGLLAGASLLVGFNSTSPVDVELPASSEHAASYKVDRVHSSVVFRIMHAGVAPFYGVFGDFDGQFTFDADSPESGSFEFTVKTESVDTRNSGRDDHLRNADFFNSRQFPEITFKSTGVSHVEDNQYKLEGHLTFMGETQPVTADLEWMGTGTNPRGAEIAGFGATFEIKRSDFGMTKYLAPDNSDSGGIGNTVTLMVGIEAIKG